MQFDEDRQEVILKVVYYGPALGGKTTNLVRLHEHLPAEQRGDFVALDTYQDRTLFFDLLPFFLVAPSGLRLKLKAYTVPGQVRYDSTRKTVLSGADGVVFVADSQTTQQFNNSESFANLETNCKALGMCLGDIPLVIQFNKRDLGNIVTEEQVRDRWTATGLPVVFASAINDVNVVDTFVELCSRLYRCCDDDLELAREHGLSEAGFFESLGVPA